MRNAATIVLGIALTAVGCAHFRGTNDTFRDRVGTSVLKGIDALLTRQHADGSWGGDDVKVQNSHKSDYPVAISSLAYLALMTAAPEHPEAARARETSLSFIFDTIKADGRMKNTRDNTPKVHERDVWSQAFSIFVFSRVLGSDTVPENIKKQIRAETENMLCALMKTQQTDGGWTYNRAPSDTMLTATVLMGLTSARKAGLSVPGHLIGRSAAFLKKYSAPGDFVAYKGTPTPAAMKGEVGDSLGRSVLLELALIEANVGSKKRLVEAVDTFFEYRHRLDKVRDLEEGCHQPPYRIGTFYCFYSYFYVALSLEKLDGETKRKYRPILEDHFLTLQKNDGHWIDSKDHCGESYGTAMGLLVLSAPIWADCTKLGQRHPLRVRMTP